MQTLLLDTVAWDLVLDAKGNIAVASEPYAMAQDAASAIKLWKGEMFFDAQEGVPYREKIMGKRPPVPLIKALFVEAAKTVPDVAQAVCYISEVTDRVVHGQVQVADVDGRTGAAAF